MNIIPQCQPRDPLFGVSGDLPRHACRSADEPAESGPPLSEARQLYKRVLDAYPEVRRATGSRGALCDAPPPPRSPQTVVLLIGTFVALPEFAEAFVAALAKPLRRLIRAIIAEEMEGRKR